ncbi:MAG: hypothetical protein DWQ19_12580 [Crenarchaeota archaeon]|nr:MAG: hypothetical protein DWQ19_12580 [Thermoproteota archaeon]
MINESVIRPKGEIEMIIKNKETGEEKRCFHNTVLKKGKEALASSIANDIGSSYNFFISRMLFGDGGTSSGVPKSVSTERNGLFGITRASKPVISTIDSNLLSQVVFTSVLDYDEVNGVTLNEMALQMNSGDLYSMATFGDLNKTSSIQITWLWRISFV